MPTFTPTLWTYNSCQNANTALNFVIIIGVETSRYLIKMTIVTVERKQLKVLTARSLQLLCIVGGDQAKLNGVQKSQIRYAHPISPDCHQLYIVIVAKPYAWLQELQLFAIGLPPQCYNLC